MEANEIGAILRHPAAGPAVRSLVDSFLRLHLEAQLHPITRYNLFAPREKPSGCDTMSVSHTHTHQVQILGTPGVCALPSLQRS
jgi:hypothetical protein